MIRALNFIIRHHAIVLTSISTSYLTHYSKQGCDMDPIKNHGTALGCAVILALVSRTSVVRRDPGRHLNDYHRGLRHDHHLDVGRFCADHLSVAPLQQSSLRAQPDVKA